MLQNTIELIAIRPYEGSATLIAHLDLMIGDIIIHGAKIMKNDENNLWVAFPSVEKNGKYYAVVEIDSRSLDREIRAEIVCQYRQKAVPIDFNFGDATAPQPLGFTEEKEPQQEDSII